MSTSRRKTTYHHGDLRRALVDAGRGTRPGTGRRGTHAPGRRRRAGVSPLAPYRHFPDKEALLAEVMAEGFRKLAATMSEAEGTRPLDRMHVIGQRYLAFTAGEPALYRLMFGGTVPDRASHPALDAAESEAYAIMRAVIAEAIDRRGHPRRLGRRRPVDDALRDAGAGRAHRGRADAVRADPLGRAGRDECRRPGTPAALRRSIARSGRPGPGGPGAGGPAGGAEPAVWVGLSGSGGGPAAWACWCGQAGWAGAFVAPGPRWVSRVPRTARSSGCRCHRTPVQIIAPSRFLLLM